MIESVQNLKIKKYLKLINSSKFRKQSDMLAVEGVRLIFDLLKFGIKIKNMFLTKSCLEKTNISRYNITKDLDYEIISEYLAKKISFVKSNQGAFAIFKKPKALREEEIKKKDYVLALYEINDPGNLGTLIRTAFSFGFLKIITHNCCDIYNEKVVRSSMGAVLKVKVLNCKDFIKTIKNLKKKKIEIFATSTKKACIFSEKISGKSGVLILGNEANGLPFSVIENADLNIKIKMTSFAESLNVACAGSILMYEMRKFSF